MTYTIPDIETVDFSDPHDIGGYVSLICQAGANLGMAMPDFRHTAESSCLRQLAGRVVRRLDEQMPRMTVADALLTVMPYDMIHRLAHATPADPKVVNRYILSALDAKIHGDKVVDEYELFRHIRAGIMRRDKAYFDKPLIWYGLSLERWYNEALRGYEGTASHSSNEPDSQSRLSDYDIISRVTLLLESDLYSYEGRSQATFKQTLVDTHRHYLDTLTTSAPHDPHTLTALSQFLSASHPYLTPEDHTRYTEALSARHHHPTFNAV